MMPARLSVIAAACLFALPALAQPLPPADGLALSTLIAQIEADDALGPILEVEWEDEGYWEIEVVNLADGRKIEIKLDPHTGARLQRR